MRNDLFEVLDENIVTIEIILPTTYEEYGFVFALSRRIAGKSSGLPEFPFKKRSILDYT
jgi:hypothetical protein